MVLVTGLVKWSANHVKLHRWRRAGGRSRQEGERAVKYGKVGVHERKTEARRRSIVRRD